MMGVPLFVLVPVAIYFAGVVFMATAIMPWLRSNVRRNAADWDLNAGQVQACEGMSTNDFWWVSAVWPILAVLFLLLKISSLVKR